MQTIIKLVKASLILNIIIFFVSCEDNIENKEAEVSIIRIFTSALQTGVDAYGILRNEKQANVRYTIKNIGTKTITGWKIYFYVSLENGPQMSVGGRAAYTLDPGEISSEKLVTDRITSGNGNVTSATLNLIEAY